MSLTELLSATGSVANLGGFLLALYVLRLLIVERAGWESLMDRLRQEVATLAEEVKGLRAENQLLREEIRDLHGTIDRMERQTR